uniref:Uncharacterized protein n=1 Tax=Oryza punctata TaxID=4537 RepID=A0A0E0KUD4_ORYPU
MRPGGGRREEKKGTGQGATSDRIFLRFFLSLPFRLCTFRLNPVESPGSRSILVALAASRHSLAPFVGLPRCYLSMCLVGTSWLLAHCSNHTARYSGPSITASHMYRTATATTRMWV